jgi:hypothetical protein
MERVGLWESFVSGWRTVVSAVVSFFVGAIAPSQGIKPVETFVLALGAFALILFVWGLIRPPSTESCEAAPDSSTAKSLELEAEKTRIEKALTDQIAERDSTITELRSKLAGESQSSAECQMRLQRLEAERREGAEKAEQLWMLKRHAREIRRRWPNADFMWYPAAKGL